MQITVDNATEYARNILSESYPSGISITGARQFEEHGVSLVDVSFFVASLGYPYVMTCWIERDAHGNGYVYGEW